MRRTLLALLLLAVAPSAGVAQRDSTVTIASYLDLETVADAQVSPDGQRIIYTRRYVNARDDQWETALWMMDADGGRQRFLTKGSNPRWSPDGTRILYLASGEPAGTQLFVRWMDAEGATSQVTRLEHGPMSPAWSPDGRSIVFANFVAKPSRWNVTLPAAPAGAKWAEGPRVIEDLHYRQDFRGFMRRGFVHLFSVSAEGGSARQLTFGEWNVGARFDGLEGAVGFDFTPDGRTIVFDGLQGDWDVTYRKSHLYALDLGSGAVRQLTTTDGQWTQPVVSPDGRWIAYTGYVETGVTYHQADLHVMRVDGSGARNLSRALDRLIGGVRWASDNSGLFAQVTHHGTSNVRFVPLNGAIRDVTTGTHLLSLTSMAAGREPMGVGVRTAGDFPSEVVRYSLRTGAVTPLTRVNEDFLAGRTLGALEELWFTSKDGTRAHGWIVKPPFYDASKRYPLLLEIHGGPFSDYTVGFNYNYQAWAALGYVVLYTNPRGSTSYGQEFARGINFRYPGVDHEDLMAGVDAAIGAASVDTTRMYVGGCSGGGVLSSWMIGHTDRFAAAAVRCPVTNWMSMFGQTDIPYFTMSFFEKPFWEDPTRWLEQSSIMHVGKVTTPTLLMTGESDLRTPMAQTEEYFAALKYRGVPAKMLRFPNQYHGTGTRPSNNLRTILYMDDWYSQWAREGGTAVERTRFQSDPEAE
jgi:dipeptidyl aminopeptidase/acylaminoacyl peptidase